MNYIFLCNQPFVFFLELDCGFKKCRNSFEIWKFIMSNDVETLNKRYFNLNAFDEFYSSLNGSW
jgi:hypothetical protein